MLRKAVLVLGALVSLLLAVVAFGYALPVAHVATGEAQLAAPPERVFAVLHGVEDYAKWRSDVDSVEIVARAPVLRWREGSDGNAVTFELQQTDPPRQMVTRIADRTLPFGGSWTFVLQPSGSGTRLTITENGEVYNPLFRVMSRFVFGHTATIEKYLEDLQNRLR